MEVAQQPNHRPLLWLLAIALAVRVYVLLVTFCVSKDALWFVPVAQAVAAGDFRPLLESHQQPLYPLLIVPFRAFGGSWVLSAQLASLAVGTLTIVPVFQLTRRVFGPEAAALAGLLAALLPHHCRFSADAISDATYIFLFASAVWLGGAAVIERRGRDFALCGALSALAWLTRPEGAGVVLLVCALAALGMVSWLRRDWQRPALGILVAALAFTLVAFPWLLVIRVQTGQWKLQKKKDWHGRLELAVKAAVESDTDSSPQSPKPDSSTGKPWSRLGVAARELAKDTGKAAGFVLPLILIGLLAPRREKGTQLFCRNGPKGASHKRAASPFPSSDGEWYLAAMVGCYLLVLLAFARLFGYLSHRHVLPLAMVGMAWAGLGLSHVRHWLAKLCAPRVTAQTVRVAVTAVVSLVILFDALKPVRWEKDGLRTAGLWIRANGKANPSIAALKGAEAVVLYAEGRWLRLPEEMSEFHRIVAEARQRRADYLVAETGAAERTVKGFPLDTAAWMADELGLRQVYSEKLSPVAEKHSLRVVIVYEVVPPASGAP